MRKSIHLTHFTPKANQNGYALFIVLMIMIVIALLVVAAIQSYNTEQRISTNEADRKLAVSLAEAALRKGENKILDFEEKKIVFTGNCVGKIGNTDWNGLCATPDAFVPEVNNYAIEVKRDTTGLINAWERKDENGELYIDKNGQSVTDIKAESVTKNPVYIIEYISTDTTQGTIVYRVTAKAWGKNKNTVVMLQSYVANE